MDFMEHAEGPIKDFFGETVKRIAFVPFAGVTVTYEDYAAKVRGRFRPWGYEIESVHEADDAVAAVANAEAIAVGGGNTFHLMRELYETGLLEAIGERVAEGVPYIGWSAGSNVACPSVRTTNDMPIVQPRSFDALGAIPFQINPHYLDAHPTEHQGETREQRIEEFIEANPGVLVAGLREGSIFRVEGDSIELIGDKQLRVFKKGQEPVEYNPGDRIEFLLG
jgi:dipeptidase E